MTRIPIDKDQPRAAGRPIFLSLDSTPPPVIALTSLVGEVYPGWRRRLNSTVYTSEVAPQPRELVCRTSKSSPSAGRRGEGPSSLLDARLDWF